MIAKKKPDSTPVLDRTRLSLLEAAGQVFAEVGYQDATIREISSRAGTNFAAINYHFGDKKTLYFEVLRYAAARSDEKYPFQHDFPPEATPEMRLGALVRVLLNRFLEPGALTWSGKLVARELIKPTLALDAIIEVYVVPMGKEVNTVVSAFLGEKSDKDLLRFCSISVVSQCIFYQRTQPVLNRMNPKKAITPQEIEKIAAHVTTFCLGGLRQVIQDREQKKASRAKT